VEHGGDVPHHVEIGTRICRDACHEAECLHVEQQDGGGKDVYQEFRQHPVVPEQAPRRAQRLDKAREQRSEGQRDEDEPGGGLHHEISATHRLSILARQADGGQS
jgi:hypothetical protein